MSTQIIYFITLAGACGEIESISPLTDLASIAWSKRFDYSCLEIEQPEAISHKMKWPRVFW